MIKLTDKILDTYKEISLVICFCTIAFSLNAQQNRNTLSITLDLSKKAQTIDNFGASGCWYAEGIGKFWPTEKKEKISQLLFSQKIDSNGKLEGIGLSAWRFNIGAGSFEQGDSSGIKDFNRRTDSFLNPDGTYNWSKQEGQRFFLGKAKYYGVENFIAFSNSPPVQFTKNGLGFKTEKDYISNLREDKYEAYAQFLTDVLKHFSEQGTPFNYISPVNEPQWDWSRKYMEADQEGSPWTNSEIFNVTKTLNAALETTNLNTQILISEAATLTHLYAGSGKANRQIQHFFGEVSNGNVNTLSHVPKIIAGHSYFTESDAKTLVETRKSLADTIAKYKINYWQSEYSMLGDGFKDGFSGDRTAMDCALFLAKVIHTDLTVGNATAWQFWNSFEPGNSKRNTRYYLIGLQPNTGFKDGNFAVTKNLWALGHYSRFIRPGMVRILGEVSRSSRPEVQKDIFYSAYLDKNKQLVLVITNYGTTDVAIDLALKNGEKKYRTTITYVTDGREGVDMKFSGREKLTKSILISARSIQTILID